MSDGSQRDRHMGRSPGRGLLAFLGFGIVTVVMTWPMAAHLDRSFATHPDYFSNLWNIWWMGKALFELGTPPWTTEFLFHPHGVWLATHTLSPANSVTGALLGPLLGPTAAFNLLTLIHFWMGGWVLYLLACELTASRQGAFLGGLVYAFCPFHFYYLPMINIASMESPPLAALFFMRTYRHGGPGNALGACAAMLLAATSSWYYVPFIGLLAVGLTACGRLWAPEVDFRVGLRRVAIAGIAGSAAILPVVLPLLAAAFSTGAEAPVTRHDLNVGHDLLGFSWANPPGHRLLVWPAAVGYTAMLLIALGGRTVWRQKTWLVLLAAFAVLGMGGSLRIAGSDTGIPLPMAWLNPLPILGMLRSPDRFFVLVQLCVGVLCAYGWRGLAGSLRTRRARTLVGSALAVLVVLEYRPAPLASFPDPTSPYLGRLAWDDQVRALIDLPPFWGPVAGLYNRGQIEHGKKIANGYVTLLAVSPKLRREADRWARGFAEIRRSDALVRRIREDGFDRVVLHRQQLAWTRLTSQERDRVLWKPFSLLSAQLMPRRQSGGMRVVPTAHGAAREALRLSFGDPVYEDERIHVFRVR